MRRRFTLVLASVALGACSGDTKGAVATGALGVAGAALHRSSGGCWGQCLNGLVCDRESGTCVERPTCGGRCRRDERCEEGTVPRCVPLLGVTPSAVGADAGPDAAVDGDAGQ